MPGVRWFARVLPRSVRYWVILNAALEVSRRDPQQVIPDITWSQMAEVLD